MSVRCQGAGRRDGNERVNQGPAVANGDVDWGMKTRVAVHWPYSVHIITIMDRVQVEKVSHPKKICEPGNRRRS